MRLFCLRGARSFGLTQEQSDAHHEFGKGLRSMQVSVLLAVKIYRERLLITPKDLKKIAEPAND